VIIKLNSLVLGGHNVGDTLALIGKLACLPYLPCVLRRQELIVLRVADVVEL
jgi:hypothetical protein